MRNTPSVSGSVLLAVLSGFALACSGSCHEGCENQFEDCLDTGRSREECTFMLEDCQASCPNDGQR